MQFHLPGTADLNLARVEARTIAMALIEARGEQKAAAVLLGLSPRVLNYKLRHHGLYELVEIAMTDPVDAIGRVNRFLATWTPIVVPVPLPSWPGKPFVSRRVTR